MTSTDPIEIQNRFGKCVDFILAHETEYNRDGSVKVEEDRRDPGGRTKYGIDQRSHPDVDIKNLTRDEAKQIYFDSYWGKCRCYDLIPPWDLAVFDAAVNCGNGRAIRWAQEVTGTTVDGFIGPKTIAAINNSTVGEFADYLNRRNHYYKVEVRQALREVYLKGWLNRMADLTKATSEVEGTDLMA